MSSSPASKVLLLGWDAADWKVIRPLLDQGLMPNLALLMARGVHGNHATLYPDLSPMLWTTIATGKRPPKHGVLGFSEPTADGTAVQPCSVLSRTTKAVWNILTQEGKRSLVVGWWPSFPAEPINGVMVSNHFQTVSEDPDAALPPLANGMVHPEALADELGELRIRPWELSLDMLRMFVPKAQTIDQGSDKSLHDLAKIVAENLSIHSVGTDLLETEEWDFAAIYFDAIDHASHRFMQFHPPRQKKINQEDFDLYKDVVSNVYQWHDAMLGRYLDLAGPDAHVIIVSDHGFHSDEQRPDWIPCEPAGPAAEHRHFGIFVMAGPGLRQGETIYGTSVLDIAPTVLTLFGLPVGNDMDGTPQVQAWKEPPLVRRIPSWDAVPGNDGRHSSDSHEDPRAAASQLEQLVALGYVNPLPADRSQAVRETVRELDYNLARALADGGKPHEAIVILERLWRDWPREHRFGLHLIDYYGRINYVRQRREALEELRLRSERFAAEAKLELAAMSAGNDEYDDPVLSRSPAAKRKQFERRRLLELQCPLDLSAVSIEQSLMENDRTTANQLLAPLLASIEAGEKLSFSRASLVASLLANLGRLDEALPIVHRLLSIEPESQHLSTLCAEIHFRRREWMLVTESAAKSLGLVYFNPRLHLILGLALARLGKREEAIIEMRVALQQNPALLIAYRALEKLHSSDPLKAFNYRTQALILRDRIRRNRLHIGDVTHTKLAIHEYDFETCCRRAPVENSHLHPETVTIVTGLPRSGTSMLMRVLHFGGIPLLSDGIRQADQSNLLGYFEYEPIKDLVHANRMASPAWVESAKGKALKVVTPLVFHLPRIVDVRLVVVHRPLSQVMQSQEAMKERQDGHAAKQGSVSDLAARFSVEMGRIDTWANEQPQWHVLHVSYDAMLADTAEQCRRMGGFFGSGFDPESAVAGVDPTQRHFH